MTPLPDYTHLLFILSGGRLSDVEGIANKSVVLAYDFIYKKRVDSLNDGLRILQQHEDRERNKR